MRFAARSLEAFSWGQDLTQILTAALNAVDPFQAVKRYLENIDINNTGRIIVVGAGKAGLPMAQAVDHTLGARITAGQVTVKEGYGGIEQVGKIKIVEAGHPLPDQRGIHSTQQILKLLENTHPDDLVICLISGGGSALLTDPLIPLEDLRRLTDQLLASGADIQEINTLRKQLDRVKGGGLAAAAQPAQILALILSDVVGDPLEFIASGPTVPNPDTHEDARKVLEKYHISLSLDYPTSHSLDLKTSKLQNFIIGNNRLAAQAALEKAKELGYHIKLLTTEMQGEARQVGEEYAHILRSAAQIEPRPFVWVAGGETTVTLQGQGQGGRNQEFALAAVEILASLENVALITLATDGGDGPTDAAGAVVTGETLARAKDFGLDPQTFLANNDAHNFFAPLGSLLKPGPTQTNVNDLVFLVGV